MSTEHRIMPSGTEHWGLRTLCPHGEIKPHTFRTTEKYGGRLRHQCEGGRLPTVEELLDAVWSLVGETP